jgi:two-component system sensor histidine kinase UhpB
MLKRDSECVVLTVRDYGLGLSPQHTPGTGIRGMQERAALIGAQLQIGNCATGPGAQVRLTVPVGR